MSILLTEPLFLRYLKIIANIDVNNKVWQVEFLILFQNFSR